MFHKQIIIKDGAFVISDAHYSHIRPHFLDFLKDINSKKLKPTQLILMGDIFDVLVGGVKYTQKINQEALELLNKIASEVEVIYLEGNHDFNLKKVFENIDVFPISQQPLLCDYNGKKVMLAHGDFKSNYGYRLYTFLIRNPFIIMVLSFLDSISGHFIIHKLNEYLSKKNDCKEFSGFKEFIHKRLAEKFDCDYFIEGHFHQNKGIDFEKFRYMNLGAFACNQRYFIVKSSKELMLLEENIFSKEDLKYGR